MGSHAPLYHAASITDQNQFSTNLSGDTPQIESGIKGIKLEGNFVLDLKGTWVANVVVQRSADLGVTFETLGNGAGGALVFTANDIYRFFEPCRGIMYRFGVKTGGFTSGTVQGSFQQ